MAARDSLGQPISAGISGARDAICYVADPSRRSRVVEAGFNKKMVFVSESLSAVITLFHPKSCLWSCKTAIAAFPAHSAMICLLRIVGGKRSGEVLVAEVVAAPSPRLHTCEMGRSNILLDPKNEIRLRRDPGKHPGQRAPCVRIKSRTHFWTHCCQQKLGKINLLRPTRCCRRSPTDIGVIHWNDN